MMTLIDILGTIVQELGWNRLCIRFQKLGDKLIDVSSTHDKSIRESKISDHTPLVIT